MAWFLDKIFGSKKEKIREKKAEKRGVITLNELRRWCDSYVREGAEKTVHELEERIEKIIRLKDEAAGIIHDLAEFEFPEDVKERVYKPVLTHKPAYVKGMREVLSGLGRPEKSLEGYKRFHTGLTNTLLGVQKIQLSHGRFLVNVFRDELFSLGGVLNKIIDLNGDYGNVLGDHERSAADCNGLLTQADGIEEGIKRLEALKGEISGIEKSLQELDEEKAKRSKELDELTSSARYLEYSKAKEALEEKRIMRRETESQILNLLAPKTRTFRKYQKYLEEKGKRDEFLGEYIADPTSAFLREEPGFPHLRRIIRGLEQALQDGGMRLDEKEAHTVAVDWQALGKLKMAVAELEVVGLDESPERARESLAAETQRITGDKERLSQKIQHTKEEISGLKKTVAREKKNLEKDLARVRAEEYSIVLPSF